MEFTYENALRVAGANVLAFSEFGSYQGDWWAKVEYEGRTFWVHGYYGSCSGCDAIEADFDIYDTHCPEHRWDRKKAEDCGICKANAAKLEEKFVEFGKGYLTDDTYDQDGAIKEASKHLEWDSDAQEVVAFLTSHADAP